MRAWPALAGWMGHADVFGFARDFAPHPGIKRFLAGTPPVAANELAKPLLDIWPKIDPQQALGQAQIAHRLPDRPCSTRSAARSASTVTSPARS